MKKTFFLLILTCSAVLSAANLDICAAENRDYKVGENVTFTATAWDSPGKKMTQGKFSIIWRDSRTSGKGTTIDVDLAESNPVTFTAKLDRPGFIFVAASVCTMPDGKKVNWARKPFSPNAGAAVEPHKIRQGEPAPADFYKFWQDGIKEWEKAKVTVTPAPEIKMKNYKVSRIKVDFPDGSGAVDGFLAVPAAKGKYPVFAGVPGAGHGIISPVIAFVPGIPAIRLAMNVHNFPTSSNRTEQIKRYKEYNAKMPGKIYTLQNSDNRYEYIFRKAWLSVNRALEYVMTLEEFNGKDVVVSGSSQGGGSALVIAGLNPKVSCVVAGVPALCDHGAWRVNRQSGWPMLHGYTKGKSDKAAPYFDAANFASYIKVPTIVTIGYIDGVCFPTSCYAAYNNLKGPKKMVPEYRYGHIIPYESALAVRKFINEQLKHSKNK